ncbi:MAG: T9SS type A sorting domain-containing protein, partial [Ignavibacteria bacterium]|nr:T9SS type A sorting domain-containing protein [Ignavibacteria bacterium]
PNTLPNGIRRVEELSASSGALLNLNTDNDGLWSSGANTVNPGGGATNPIVLTEDDIPLPVIIGSMNIEVSRNNVHLRWTTLSEINNAGFTLMRKSDKENSWKEVAFVQGKGNSSQPVEYSFSDFGLQPGKYTYKLLQRDYNGGEETFNFPSSAEVERPAEFNLSQNYPNPSNPSSVIEFTLPEKSRVSLKVYDVSGRMVLNLAEGIYEAGYHKFTFNGTSLASGVYFYRLEAQSGELSYTRTMKMVLIK